jgi:hypothetical protein
VFYSSLGDLIRLIQSLVLFLAYVIALHPEVHDKSRNEIETVLEETDDMPCIIKSSKLQHQRGAVR